MCDSFVALGNSTADGSTLLAKSADTEVNEAEHIVRFPRREYPEGAYVRNTLINMPQARLTHEIILGKSFWSWGAELGCNEHGVAVGNEAEFSNVKEDRDGVNCLDLLRVAVERAATAREAVDIVGHHVETYGQGGNCQLMGNYLFDSGLLIADPNEAYAVECAGRHWAARKVEDVLAISNRYHITDDWDLSSLRPQNGERPDFRALFADEAREHACGAPEREAAAHRMLHERKGAITVKDMADILRDVGDEENYDITDSGERPTRICMHAGAQESRWGHATGAMIADTSADGVIVWMTGTSATDLSIFKPLFFGVPMPDVGPPPEGNYTDGALWWTHERLHRRAVADYKALKPEIRASFDALEKDFFAEGPAMKTATPAVRTEFIEDCWRRAGAATEAWIEKLERRNYFMADTAYARMWDKFNREGAFPI